MNESEEVKVQRNYKDTIFRMLFSDRRNLYSSALVSIPAPKFVVFYNGTDYQPEKQVLKLSDAYEKRQDNTELELAVTVYNINLGNNAGIMKECRVLEEYARYVKRVRDLAKKMTFPEAVEQAVDYCIQNGVLKEFLSENRAEAIAMSIFEYDEEQHLKSEREQAYRNGRDEGIAEGRKEGIHEGETRLAKLLQILSADGREEEFHRAIADPAYREQLYRRECIVGKRKVDQSSV